MIKTIVCAILLAFGSGCVHGPISWPAFVKCAAPISGALVSEVDVILAAGGDATELSAAAVAALEDLAVKYGPEALACVLGQLIDGWTAPASFQTAAEDSAKAARAQSFLNNHNVTVKTGN